MAFNSDYSSLFVFGDSLSDNGAIFALTFGTFPPTTLVGTDLSGDPVDFAARGIFFNENFTNGEVYADVTARLLDIPSDTSTFYDNAQGSNFAVGGATATDLTSFGSSTRNELSDQTSLAIFSLTTAAGSPENLAALLSGSAASIFIGLNDLGPIGDFALRPGGFDDAVIAAGAAEVVGTIAAEAETLATAGFETIILNTLPNTAFFPSTNNIIATFGPDVEVLLESLGRSIAEGIETTAALLRGQGINVEVVDFFALAREIQSDSTSYGFRSLENLLPNSDPVTTLLIDDLPADQVGFIDPVHFTAELHEVFGAFQALSLGRERVTEETRPGQLIGQTADEIFFAEAGGDEVFASAGNDLTFGGDGNDRLFSGNGDDQTFGGNGNDSVFGGQGDDLVAGGAGNDNVFGGAGNDMVAGNAGDDVLYAGSGADLIVDGLGSDLVFAGSGDDILIYKDPALFGGTSDQDRDSFNGGSGDDTLLIISDTAIGDVAAYLAARNVTYSEIETITVITNAELDVYDFSMIGLSAELGELFGLF